MTVRVVETPKYTITIVNDGKSVDVSTNKTISVFKTGVTGIDMPVAGGTYGAVLYVGATAVLAEDYDNLSYDDVNKRLGIQSIQWDLTPTQTVAEGRMFWNTDDGTLNLGMPGGNVNLQLGQEMIIRARNESGAQITNGSVVYVDGASGNKPTIQLADADNDTAHDTVGMATEDIDNNDNGYITLHGLVRGIDTSAIAEGSKAYLSQTAGEITDTPVEPPAHCVCLGWVVRSHATEGIIFLIVDESQRLQEIKGTVRTITADRTLDGTDYTVLVDCSSGNVTATLPAAADNNTRIYNIKKIDSSANVAYIDPNGSETIDGNSLITISLQYECWTVQSDGTNWVVI
jgi:hypothetical protein